MKTKIKIIVLGIKAFMCCRELQVTSHCAELLHSERRGNESHKESRNEKSSHPSCKGLLI